ncbi:MAG: hypothetical protein QOF70_1225, partial [Acetobacteraceae bacterium]|nr:hypothetical protein [Acetobacteraceae bacterium]
MNCLMCGATALMAVLIGSVGIGVQATPVSRDDFQVGTTANLLSLCGATETDPLYTAAQNFC